MIMVISWLLLAVTSHIVVAFNPLPSASFSSMSGSFETYSPIIAVLTLERHLNGVWISKLMEALVRLCKQESMNARPTLYTLESFQMSDFAKGNVSTDWLCFVNRVSDAASPTEVKACQAVLLAVDIWNIPIYNGVKCYTIGANKLLHHHMFVRAGLRIPQSTIVTYHENEAFDNYRLKFQHTVESFVAENRISFPLLVKPNSGGFGKGISIIHSMDQVPTVVDSLWKDSGFLASDGVLLIQEYIKPLQDKVYRVWFLDGKVQCAVERSFPSFLVATDTNPSQGLSSNAFAGGCAGSDGSCALDDDLESEESLVASTSQEIYERSTPWLVPAHIALEIELLLSHVGDDCYAGSVEFLFHNDIDHRVYFDLNMLSTLPLESEDEWTKLAKSIFRVALRET